MKRGVEQRKRQGNAKGRGERGWRRRGWKKGRERWAREEGVRREVGELGGSRREEEGRRERRENEMAQGLLLTMKNGMMGGTVGKGSSLREF